MAIVRFSNGVVVNFNGTPTKQDIEEVARKIGARPENPADQAGREAEAYLAKSPLKRFLGEVPQATADVLGGNIAKFGASLIETPKTLIEGKASQQTYDLPGLSPFKSFQSEAETRAGDIIEGKKPLYTALAPFAEVPLAGLEAVGVAKGASQAVKGARAGVQRLTTAASKAQLPQVSMPKGNPLSGLGDRVQKSVSQIDKGTEQVLSRTPQSKIDEYFETAKRAKDDFSVDSPLELAGNKATEAMDALSAKMKAIGEQKTALTGQLGDVDASKAVQEAKRSLNAILRERVGTQIVREDGAIVLRNAPGRLSKVTDQTDRKLIGQVVRLLDRLDQNPTFQRVDDTIDALQSMLYKSAGRNVARPMSKPVEGAIKNVVGELNANLGGLSRPRGLRAGKLSSYEKVNSDYRRLKELRDALSKALGKDSSKGGSLMKRVFSPTDGGTKRMFADIEKETGINLIDEASLARWAMNAVGDDRARNLLEMAGDVSSIRRLVLKGADVALRRGTNPGDVARRLGRPN